MQRTQREDTCACKRVSAHRAGFNCAKGDRELLSRPVIVVDVETTGTDPDKDAVVQIAACRLSGTGQLEDPPFMTYVRPTCQISAGAQAIHGLSMDDLQDAPSLDEAIQEFNTYAQPGAVLCGHNVAFDAAFLRAAYASAGVDYPFDYHILDVWSVAFFLLETQRINLRSLNLSVLCELYGIPRSSTHDALEDVRATASILRNMFAAVQEKRLDVPKQHEPPPDK